MLCVSTNGLADMDTNQWHDVFLDSGFLEVSKQNMACNSIILKY